MSRPILCDRCGNEIGESDRAWGGRAIEVRVNIVADAGDDDRAEIDHTFDFCENCQGRQPADRSDQEECEMICNDLLNIVAEHLKPTSSD